MIFFHNDWQIYARYHPPVRQTWDEPGEEAEIEIERVFLMGPMNHKIREVTRELTGDQIDELVELAWRAIA